MLNAEIDRDGTFDLIYVIALFINLSFFRQHRRLCRKNGC